MKINYRFGRCTRTQFWTRALVVSIINAFLLLIVFLAEENSFINALMNLLWLLLSIYISVWGVKRMHDVNKSGWYFIIPLYNIVLAFSNGTVGANNYGQDPKMIEGKVESDFDILTRKFFQSLPFILPAAFIACGFYAILSITRIVDSLVYSEVIKNSVLTISFIASLAWFINNEFNKIEEEAKESTN